MRCRVRTTTGTDSFDGARLGFALRPRPRLSPRLSPLASPRRTVAHLASSSVDLPSSGSDFDVVWTGALPQYETPPAFGYAPASIPPSAMVAPCISGQVPATRPTSTPPRLRQSTSPPHPHRVISSKPSLTLPLLPDVKDIAYVINVSPFLPLIALHY